MHVSGKVLRRAITAIAGCGIGVALYLFAAPGHGGGSGAESSPGADSSMPAGRSDQSAIHDPLHAIIPATTATNHPTDMDTLMRQGSSGDALRDAAVALASSTSGDDHARLAGHLGDEAFLSRLDSSDDYQGAYWQLRLGQVLKALGENPAASARVALAGLAGAPVYRTHLLRMQLLVRALAFVRPATPAVVDFWKQFVLPGSPLAFDVVEALCINQSPPALDLFASILRDPALDVLEKKAWLRQIVLPRRHDELLLAACEHLVVDGLTDELQVALVECLFHYDPDWYVGDDPPRPPAPETIGAPARSVRERIGKFALKKVRLTGPQRKAVEAALR